MIQTQENSKTTSFWAWFKPVGPKFGQPIFFSKIWLHQSLYIIYGHLSSCTVSEKTNDPILIKFSEGRTERQTHESDFMARFPTNVECPIQK